MSWKQEVLKNFRLYAVTDVREEGTEILAKVDAAYEGGADIVQLRSKTLSDRSLFQLGTSIRKISEKYQKLFFVNDRVDLALALKADGVHLGQDDLPVTWARDLARRSKQSLMVGKSTHSLKQALHAVEEEPDYIGVGPVFGTPTKPTYEPVGCELVSQVAQTVSIPFVAIGGINESNLEQVLNAGAKRVAIVRAIFSAEDVYESTRRISKFIESNLESHHV